MPQKIESAGTYIGTIADSGLGLTKNGLPQFVGRLKAEKKYVESKEEIAWFQQNRQQLLDGKPGWVDWSEYDEDIAAFLVLYSFKKSQDISPETETLNAKQLNVATGWQAPDFESLGALAGKRILFRVEFRSYTSPEGKTTEGNQVTWIDNENASPERQLKTLDAGGIKDLMSKVKGYGKPAVATARPVTATKPAAPTAAKPPVTAAPSVAAPATTTPPTAATATTQTAPAPKAAPKRQKKEAAPPADGLTQIDAWNAVNAAKGNLSDQDVETVWIEATNEVLGDRDENSATSADWQKIKDTACERISGLLMV